MNKNYKCFDNDYLLRMLFPNNGENVEEIAICENLFWAIKNNDYIRYREVADCLFDMGWMIWGNHINRISIGVERQQIRKNKRRNK